MTHACLRTAGLLACLVACLPASSLACLRALCTGRVSLLIMVVNSQSFMGWLGFKFSVLVFEDEGISRPLFGEKNRPRTVTTDIGSSHFPSLFLVLETDSMFWACLIRASRESSGQGCEDGLETFGFPLDVRDILF